MTRTALIAAMHEELAALLPAIEDARIERRGGREFWLGRLEGQEVVAVRSGIGKVAAAITATLLLDHYQAARVLFLGVAGGIGAGVQVGDVVVADALLQHDMDASPLFPRHEVPLTGLARFPADAAFSDRVARGAEAAVARHAEAAALLGHGTRVHRGLIVSGDRFVATAAESEALRLALPDALAVEMEGAAVAQACHAFGMPLAVVRSISDRADDDAHVDFGSFLTRVAGPLGLAIVQQALAPVAAAAGR
ncbi:MAG TPA: 5'-methylthioadenosine/adenosylhomocysteine nucleosidase [Ideonella sp.]|uniref:5'-methylthioadenosine/adenosylhomocysteine nucleosidase n=1 Tax=Ideonella sp. TaxID=1929293 RepID=UPI002E301AE3|nr:5'-methylthioadenosine/adenosylhomocysteine nucleosidase [Ideonella sp.]HEX5682506.1 5'-methylthioadenosine/adenosylhomocysteine nucleosidase [Ideonella sp.]